MCTRQQTPTSIVIMLKNVASLCQDINPTAASWQRMLNTDSQDADFVAQSVEASGRASYSTGDRMSTLMFYLSEVEAGGVTAFPRLGVAAKPERGAALLWHNIGNSHQPSASMSRRKLSCTYSSLPAGQLHFCLICHLQDKYNGL